MPLEQKPLATTSERAEPLVADVGFIAGRLMRDSLKPLKALARKNCPYCASMIPAAAKVCRRCYRDIA
ncbi:hypothetical protein [Caulobacter sp. FWC2]|uniref:hypothetical protein n=1 Tax=Caulobacter sp. FWC2 TaxID=69664 RepID=UPI00117877FA|nr:hypothetical protein [Caulobacter sp. FWC2]